MTTSRIGFIAVLMLLTGAVAAEPTPAPQTATIPTDTIWYCWYGRPHLEHIVCFRPDRDKLLTRSADPIDSGAGTLASELVATGHHATAARVMRRYYTDFEGVTRVIPMYTIPFSLESAARLARAVMCVRTPDCQVAFDLTEPMGYPKEILRAAR